RQPPEEVPIGAHRRVRNEPFVAGFRILLVELSRGSRVVELHRGVMHGARSRQEFPGSDVARGGRLDWQHEVAVDIVAGGPQCVRGRLEDEVRGSELPLAGPGRWSWEQCRIAFEKTIFKPPSQ